MNLLIHLLVFCVLVVAIASFCCKWLQYYREGKINRTIFVRNIFLEITGILLAMTLARLLGRYIAQIATAQITNELVKLIAGIVIGLLAGVSIGVVMKRIWGQLLKIRN